MIKKNDVTTVTAWCFYDWASAAFPSIITTFIFSTYFTTHIASSEIKGTYQWANATAIAGVLIAILSPVFGSIADYGGRHKLWLLLFTWITVISTSLLWFAYPNINSITYTLVFIIIATVGFEVATVFYNAYLPFIATDSHIGRISGWAWGVGYVGGITALCIALFGFIKSTPSWLDVSTGAQARICGPLTGIWLAIFSLPFFILVPDMPTIGLKFSKAIAKGIKELLLTLKSLPSQKNLTLYLIAHMVYIDGLNTLFAFGGIYAAGTFGMDLSKVILFGITMNIAAGTGAILLAWVDDFLGSKPTILISLFFLILIGVPLTLVKHVHVFWGLSLLLCLFVGPVQAASRSLLAHIIPKRRATEMFGLYAFSGKITSFIGPWALGAVTLHFGSQRAGVATIMLFFIVGGLLLTFVDATKKGQATS